MLRVLELGSYVAPAYAGMLLAEQGARVEKWVAGHGTPDPIQTLIDGDALWAWINHRKVLRVKHARSLPRVRIADRPHIILDNYRPETLERWGLDPAVIAARWGAVWVSLRSDVGGVSFDLFAQQRAWAAAGAQYVPFYVGDTTAGLWMAFKALMQHAQGAPGHYVIGQATALAKLIEGELVVTPSRERTWYHTPWDDVGTYSYDHARAVATVQFKGTTYEEPVRDRAWQLDHLWHDGTGRMRI